MKELSIICVNWNSAHYLRECLSSVYAHTPGIEFEVIVVDNASSYDDVDLLEREFPAITVIKSKENIGFARANNLGFEYSSGKHILFLNPDTKILGSAITAMLARLKSLPDAAVVGCRLLNSDLSVQTSCIQRFPTILNQILEIEALRLRWPKCKLWGIEPLFSKRVEPSVVEVVSGACLMIKRDVFQAVGSFNPDYFMYGEDVDLCHRVYQLAFKVYYVSDASIVHYGGGSSKQRRGGQWAAITQRKAILTFCRQTHGPIYASIYRMAMGFAAACRLTAVGLLLCFANITFDRQILCSAAEKWAAVLKWAIGLDRQSLRFNSSI